MKRNAKQRASSGLTPRSYSTDRISPCVSMHITRILISIIRKFPVAVSKRINCLHTDGERTASCNFLGNSQVAPTYYPTAYIYARTNPKDYFASVIPSPLGVLNIPRLVKLTNPITISQIRLVKMLKTKGSPPRPRGERNRRRGGGRDSGIKRRRRPSSCARVHVQQSDTRSDRHINKFAANHGRGLRGEGGRF